MVTRYVNGATEWHTGAGQPAATHFSDERRSSFSSSLTDPSGCPRAERADQRPAALSGDVAPVPGLCVEKSCGRPRFPRLFAFRGGDA